MYTTQIDGVEIKLTENKNPYLGMGNRQWTVHLNFSQKFNIAKSEVETFDKEFEIKKHFELFKKYMSVFLECQKNKNRSCR